MVSLRGGSMVEAFARAAFAVKIYEMTDVVQTPFGCHLILTTDRKPGKPTQFKDVKEEVKEVFCMRLREEVARRLRPGGELRWGHERPWKLPAGSSGRLDLARYLSLLNFG